MTEQELKQLVDGFLPIALAGGKVIMDIYQSDFAIKAKDDRSPVTEADEKAEKVILDQLAALCPDIPVVAEESVAAGQVPDISDGTFILVDPLDGTREFIKRNGEFTVNIALVVDGVPVGGVVHLPALDQTYWAAGPGNAWRQDGENAPVAISCRQPGAEGLVAVASRSHRDSATDDYLADFTIAELISAGSSLKLCRVAEGAADMYPRLGRTMEWDIAAGQAVLLGAGGSVTIIPGGDVAGDVGQPLSYAKPGFENPHFVARGLGA